MEVERNTVSLEVQHSLYITQQLEEFTLLSGEMGHPFGTSGTSQKFVNVPVESFPRWDHSAEEEEEARVIYRFIVLLIYRSVDRIKIKFKLLI